MNPAPRNSNRENSSSGECTKGDWEGLTNEVEENQQGMVSGKSRDKGVLRQKAWSLYQIRGQVSCANKNVHWSWQHKKNLSNHIGAVSVKEQRPKPDVLSWRVNGRGEIKECVQTTTSENSK